MNSSRLQRSFALVLLCLSAPSVAYQYFFHLRDRRDATVPQHLAASVFGSVASIAFSAPLDTIKTRIQSQHFGAHNQIGGMTVFRELIKHEGPAALFKGFVPRRAPSAQLIAAHALLTASPPRPLIARSIASQ